MILIILQSASESITLLLYILEFTGRHSLGISNPNQYLGDYSLPYTTNKFLPGFVHPLQDVALHS